MYDVPEAKVDSVNMSENEFIASLGWTVTVGPITLFDKEYEEFLVRSLFEYNDATRTEKLASLAMVYRTNDADKTMVPLTAPLDPKKHGGPYFVLQVYPSKEGMDKHFAGAAYGKIKAFTAEYADVTRTD